MLRTEEIFTYPKNAYVLPEKKVTELTEPLMLLNQERTSLKGPYDKRGNNWQHIRPELRGEITKPDIVAGKHWSFFIIIGKYP